MREVTGDQETRIDKFIGDDSLEWTGKETF